MLFRGHRKNRNLGYKIFVAAFIALFFLLYTRFSNRGFHPGDQRSAAAQIPQLQRWSSGYADEEKAAMVTKAMERTFRGYREKAWGWDEIKPITGGQENSRNGWGAFIVDSSTTLVIMGLWDELRLSVKHIVDNVDFSTTETLVDPFETTIRYIGALVSLVDMADAGLIPEHVVGSEGRDKILSQTKILADKLAYAYDTPSGMPWPRVDFATNKGSALNPHKHPVSGPARSGSNILELYTLGRLLGDLSYLKTAESAWNNLVQTKFPSPWAGMVDAPVDIFTAEPVASQRHWDSGHDSYYEYLIKAYLLLPWQPATQDYRLTWMRAARSLRTHLATRLTPTDGHWVQHLFIGQHMDGRYVNSQSHLAHFAPGNIILGGKAIGGSYGKTLIDFGKALLEGSHHTYASSPSGIGPEIWSWVPNTFPALNEKWEPGTERQETQLNATGLWVRDAEYKLRPEYVESLFYAWRITGEERHRAWAWDAFVAIQRGCRTKFGYASVADVWVDPKDPEWKLLDKQESFWAAESLKYFYLIFADVSVGSLDDFVYSTEAHLFRRRPGDPKKGSRADSKEP